MTVKIDGTNTVANPAFTGADTDTGLQCGTNELKLVTGGSARATVDSSGNVGIGTTSPESNRRLTVDIGTTSANVAVFKSQDTGGGSYIGFMDKDTTNGNRVRVGAINDDMAFITAGSEVARFDSSGNLRTPEQQDVVFGVDLNTSSGDGGDLTVKSGNGSGSGNNSGNLYLAAGRGGSSANSGFIAFGIAQTTNTSGLNAEHARFDSDGRLLVGIASPQSTDSTIESFKSSGGNHIRVQTNSLGNGQFSMFRAAGTASGGSIRQAYFGVYKHSGITQAAGMMMLEQQDGGNSYYWTDDLGKLRTSTNQNHIGTYSGTIIGTQTSDLRLKNVGANVSYGLAEVKQLQPKQYALKGDPDVNKLGFIAQEVESIIPEAVFDTNEELDGHEEGDRTKLGMEYVQLIPVLVNAIKELSAEVDTLKTKVATLEAAE